MEEPRLEHFYSGDLTKPQLIKLIEENQPEISVFPSVLLVFGSTIGGFGAFYYLLVEARIGFTESLIIMFLIFAGGGWLMKKVDTKKPQGDLKSVTLAKYTTALNAIERFENAKQNYLNWNKSLTTETGKNYWLKLRGVELEDALEKMLLRLGWSVETTPVTSDGGIDLVTVLKSEKILFQCKGLASPLGVGAIRDAAGVQATAKNKMIVVAPKGFTSGAKQFATQAQIELWDVNVLIEKAAAPKQSSVQ